MFDYFRYVMDEINGIDAEKAEEERREKERKNKEERYIFSKKAKIIIAVMGVFYFIISVFTLMSYRENGDVNIIGMLLSVAMGLLSAGVAVCMIIQKKIAEKYALIGIGCFILLFLINAIV